MAEKRGITDVIKDVGVGIFNRTIGRLRSSGIDRDNRLTEAVAKWSGRNGKTDWRVRLQVPQGTALEKFFFTNNKLLLPLRDSRGMFWPLTPTMQLAHSASYDALAQTHSNYPFQAYRNSQVQSINLIGEFPVQNQDDARHWVATVNFLRTATKMFFGLSTSGQQDLKGNPPPILHFSGYGSHMFDKVPVVVSSFNVELKAGIDYISTQQSDVYRDNSHVGAAFNYNEEDATWAPTLSNISAMLTPIYSRETLKNFSMSDFVRGKLNKERGIGFI